MRTRAVKGMGIVLGAAAGLCLIGAAAIYVASEQIIDRHYPLPESHVRAATDAASISLSARA